MSKSAITFNVSAPLPSRVVITSNAARARTQRSCLRFTSVLLLLCLLLQRFGFPLGEQSVSIVGPLGLALAGWGLATRTLAMHRQRTALFLGLVGLAVIGAAWHAMTPNAYGTPPSMKSLIQFLALTGFGCLSFAEAVDEAAFFRIFSNLLALIALAGILQFVAQFAGLSIFRFGDFLPASILFEHGYNLEIPVGIGSLLKANGFFLVEPSVFSQVLAVGIMIEILTSRRPARLALFAIALLLSFSGTGLIVLAVFLATAGLRVGRRAAVAIVGSAVALVIMVAAVVILVPAVGHIFQDRLAEFSDPKSSAFTRFVTPFWLAGDVLARTPSALLAGIGASVSEHLTVPYEYAINTPVKIFLEYGAPLLAVYVALFCVAARTVLQGALFLPCMVLFFFTGGYQQFAPLLFPILLLVAVARLAPSAGGTPQGNRPRAEVPKGDVTVPASAA